MWICKTGHINWMSARHTRSQPTKLPSYSLDISIVARNSSGFVGSLPGTGLATLEAGIGLIALQHGNRRGREHDSRSRPYSTPATVVVDRGAKPKTR